MSNTYILHAGVKGMRWGVRRYQNEDGSLTEAGRKRYGRSGIRPTQEPKNRVETKIKQPVTTETTAKTVEKGAEVVRKLLLANVVDDVFYGGAGKRIAKETIKQTGRVAVTAYTMSRGGYDIRWYDN